MERAADAAGRPAFGVAKPMQGGGPARSEPDVAEQFPPLPGGQDPLVAPSD